MPFYKTSEALIFGEDSGNIGDVNQGLEGMQGKIRWAPSCWRGHSRSDNYRTRNWNGIKRFTHIAEIQYLDYLLYAIQIISDDLKQPNIELEQKSTLNNEQGT
jgi:hypothetical protein